MLFRLRSDMYSFGVSFGIHSYATFRNSFPKLLPLWDRPGVFWFPELPLFAPLARKLELLLPFSAGTSYAHSWGYTWGAQREKKTTVVLSRTSSGWRESFTSFSILGICDYWYNHYYKIAWVQKYGGKLGVGGEIWGTSPILSEC